MFTTFSLKAAEIKLDGKLDDNIWKTAKKFEKFYRYNTIHLSNVQTTALFNYDEENIYVAFICKEPRIDILVNDAKRNSPYVYYDDNVEFNIDCDNDRKSFYHILINPKGFCWVEFWVQPSRKYYTITNFKSYISAGIEGTEWIIEMMIPFYTITEEQIKNEININFARTRRAGFSDNEREESAVALKGQFLDPTVFIPTKLEKIDLDSYSIKISSPQINEIKLVEKNIGCKLSFEIKNCITKDRNVFLDIKDGKLGTVYSKNITLLPDERKEILLNLNIPESGIYKFNYVVKENNKTVFDATYPIEIKLYPITLDIVKPNYRDSIYATQKLDEIIISYKVELDEKEYKDGKFEISVNDNKNNNVVPILYEDVKKEGTVTLKLPETIDAGKYQILFKIIKDNGIILEENIFINKYLPAKGREVRVDENLNLLVDNTPFFPITWWAGAKFEDIATTGADAIIVQYSKNITTILDQLKSLNQYAVLMPFNSVNSKKYLYDLDNLS